MRHDLKDVLTGLNHSQYVNHDFFFAFMQAIPWMLPNPLDRWCRWVYITQHPQNCMELQTRNYVNNPVQLHEIGLIHIKSRFIRVGPITFQ